MNQFFFLFVILLLCCTATAASNGGKSGEMNNQIATFNISALSAQVIAGAEEAKKIEDTTTPQEDVVDTEAYRLFTLQRDSEIYIESLGEGGYTGSLLNFIAIDADTTCYFCIPRSEWPTAGWQKQEG